MDLNFLAIVVPPKYFSTAGPLLGPDNIFAQGLLYKLSVEIERVYIKIF